MIIPWLKIGAGLAVIACLAGIYLTGVHNGRQAVLQKLQDDRITILKDGRKIDEKALGADDAGLCDLLGGCIMPEHISQ